VRQTITVAGFTLRFDIELRNHNSGMQSGRRLPDCVVTRHQPTHPGQATTRRGGNSMRKEDAPA